MDAGRDGVRVWVSWVRGNGRWRRRRTAVEKQCGADGCRRDRRSNIEGEKDLEIIFFARTKIWLSIDTNKEN